MTAPNRPQSHCGLRKARAEVHTANKQAARLLSVVIAESSESEMERATRRDLSSGVEDSSSGGAAAEEDTGIDEHSNESDKKEHSESVETISPPTSPRDNHNGSSRKETGRYYSDRFSYLESMSRQERRRIEGEIIKGRKPGE